MKNLTLIALSLFLLSSCVGKKKYDELMVANEKLQLTYDETKTRLDECLASSARYQDELRMKEREIGSKDSEIQSKNQQVQQLQNQVDNLQNTNNNLLDRLSDLSIVSKAGAESIKQSLESINAQSKYIQDLTSKIQTKDSVNLALVMNLKRSLSDINDEDIQIDVRGGVVYVSIADKLLFRSGSSRISSRAEEVLGKVAKVVNDHADLDIMVEGHTDNVPISNSCIEDNWDLSVKRATAVVRVLKGKHGVAASRLTAAGRGEFMPKTTNDTSDGRSTNRRTEIIITPKLDQFFKLMEAPETKN